MTKSLGRRLVGALIVALLCFGVAILMLSEKPGGLDKSVAESHPEGRRAAFLVLQALGFEVRAWHQAPIFLAGVRGCLWMPMVPALTGATDAPADASEAAPAGDELSADDPRHPAHYGEFVRAGGTLLLPFSAQNLDWLRGPCGLEVPAWPHPQPRPECELELDTGESLRVSLRAAVRAEDFAFDAQQYAALGWHDIAWGSQGEPFASWAAVGYGRVAFLASDSFLDNGALGEFDNGLLLTRIAETLRGPGQLFFDEYALGLWTPQSKRELLLSPGIFEFSAHALFALLLFVALHAWVREFPRGGRASMQLPRLRVQAQAALMLRAGRLDLLAQDLKLGVLLRVLRRLGIREPEASEDARARLMELTRTLLDSAPLGLERGRWEPLLCESEVHDLNDLEQLGHDLRAFEQHAQALASHRPPAKKPS